MTSITRRSVLKQASATAAGLATAAWHAPALGTLGANERVNVGVLGCGRGLFVAQSFAGHNVRIVYVCDPDEARATRAQKAANADQAVADLRRVLDDKSIDAVVVATPDYWHAPAAIMACEAGKHVYVEKPCAHNVHEGRLMIEAARRTGRVMQVGSQSRSTTVIREGIQQIREGAIGKVLVAKAWNSQLRENIGHVQPSDPPPGFDYDLWIGPAPMRPFQSNCHHVSWRWWYDFGSGDAGNDGIHELDIARWGLGVDGHPSVVTGHGSKMFFDDDQQFPDTQYVTFEYAPQAKDEQRKLLVYEHRIWSPYHQQGSENGNAFYGTKGYLILAKGSGWQLFGPRDELIKEKKGKYSTDQHTADFLDAIRADRRPNADIEIGHGSATLVHLANILARTGQQRIVFDPDRERIDGNAEADALLTRSYRKGHWAVPQGV